MLNPRPVYRIGAAGLDPRDWRLIEIVFKHSQYNRFEFQLKPDADATLIDILIANTNDPAGVKAVSAVRTGNRPIPIIAAVPRGALGAGRHAISIDRLTLQLLPILNRVVEVELNRVPAQLPPSVPAAMSTNSLAAGPALVSAATMTDIDSIAVPVPAKVAAVTMQSPTVVPLSGMRQPALDSNSGPIAKTTILPADAKAVERLSLAPLKPTANVGPLVGANPASNLVMFPRGSVAPPPAPQQLRVLVVDDSPTVRQQLSLALQRMGLACDAVGSADDAIDRVAEQHYDLALLDVVMPNVDGYKLTRHLKRDKQHRQMPIILLTSKSSPFDLVRGALAGCDTYLVKPVPLKALEAALLKQLRKSLAIDDLSAMLRPQPSAEQSAPPAAQQMTPQVRPQVTPQVTPHSAPQTTQQATQLAPPLGALDSAGRPRGE